MKWFKKLSLLAMAGGLLAGVVAPASVSAQGSVPGPIIERDHEENGQHPDGAH